MRFLIAGGLCIFPVFALCAESPWQNEIELGFLLNRGNTHNTHFNSRFTNQFANDQLSNKFSIASLVNLAKDLNTLEKSKTAEKYTARDNIKFQLSENNYIYSEINGQKDKFSAFDYEVTESVGLGRKLLNTDTLKWYLEGGPGGYHNRTTHKDFSRSHQDEWIGHAGTELIYAINRHAEFSQEVTLDVGNQTQKTKSSSALKAKIFDSVALKLSYRLEYHAKLPDTGKVQKHTQSLTSVTATYSF